MKIPCEAISLNTLDVGPIVRLFSVLWVQYQMYDSDIPKSKICGVRHSVHTALHNMIVQLLRYLRTVQKVVV